ncbi:MAG TPA: helix-turn-helix domain-containing protein, partial [Archangium sp.]
HIVPITLPPLRERPDDILLLADHFVRKHAPKVNRKVRALSADARKLLVKYRWPGNVRELENAMERAVLLADGTRIVPENLPEKLWSARPAHAPSGTTLPTPEQAEFSLKRAIEIVESNFIRAALRKTKGNRTRAAELLEISHRALLYKLKDYGIDADAEGEKGA